MLEIETTPNRPDLSIYGLAREVAAILGRAAADAGLRSRSHGRRARGHPHRGSRAARATSGAPFETWDRRVADVAQGAADRSRDASDLERRRRHELRALLGSPLHAFDQSKLAEGRIVVRRAHPDEEIRTSTAPFTLTPEDLVIADAARPVAIAGVMGGEDSEVTEATSRPPRSGELRAERDQRTSERLELRSRPRAGGRRSRPRRIPARLAASCSGSSPAPAGPESDVSAELPDSRSSTCAPSAPRSPRPGEVEPDEQRILEALGFEFAGTSPCRPGAPATSLARSTWSRRSAG